MIQAIKVSVDAVVFGYDPQIGVSLLLIKRKLKPFQNSWALPGGLVKNTESLEEAVKRELKEEAGIDVSFLEQLYTFGKKDRDPRNRVVSVAYYGLVKPNDYQISAQTDAIDVSWYNITKLPSLAFDHKDIVVTAIKRLRSKITYEPIGFELLDKKFPFSDLENLYFSILDQQPDRRNFKKKFMALGILEELPESVQRGPGRPAKLFQFNKKKYFDLQTTGYIFNLFLK